MSDESEKAAADIFSKALNMICDAATDLVMAEREASAQAIDALLSPSMSLEVQDATKAAAAAVRGRPKA